jgi:predicted PurR-regulated permease PerM
MERRRRDVFPPLLAALAVILVLAFQVFRPFFLVFAVAGSVAILLAPVQRRLTRSLGGRAGLAAVLIVTFTTVAILVPLVTALSVLGQRALAFLSWLGPRLQPGEIETFWRETLPERIPWLQEWTSRFESQFATVVSSTLGRLASAATAIVQGTVAGLAFAVVELGLFLLILFFLLRDGARLRGALRPISPFSDEQEALIFEHLGKTVKGALQSMIVVPLAQGVMALLGFWIFEVPSPVSWSVAVFLAAMVPLFGSPLGWVPAVVYLFYSAASWQWIGMLLYGTLVISGIDNLVKPLLLRGTAQIHPLLGFLSILGGVLAYGISGFLVGPVVLSLVLSATRIYKLDVVRAPATIPPSTAAAT